jgi:endonuclease-8
MPEGDTVHRIASSLDRELRGEVMDRIELQDLGSVPELERRQVESVQAVGKHLLLNVEGGWTVRVHLGMKGKWRRLHRGQARPRHPTLLIQRGDTLYVCVRAYRAELVRTSALRSHPRLSLLGPDLLRDPPPLTEAVARATLPGYRHREIGEVLLDQHVASGIGNVYKSEVLFACRAHPRTLVGTLKEDALVQIYQEAARMMRANLKTVRRTSVPLQRRPHPSSPRLWVYGRDGKPCLECGVVIERIVQGDMARPTYLCPACQDPDRSTSHDLPADA